MTKFGAAENKMERLTAKFAQRTPAEHPLFAQTQNLPKHVNLITLNARMKRYLCHHHTVSGDKGAMFPTKGINDTSIPSNPEIA